MIILTISIALKGTYKSGFGGSPKTFMEKLAKALAEHLAGTAMFTNLDADEKREAYILYGKNTEEKLEKKVMGLSLNLHPAAEPIVIYTFKPKEIAINAVTSAVGPGYHQFLCDVIKSLTGNLGIEWSLADCDDPTGYFFHGNRTAMESTFQRWLADRCSELLDLGQSGAQYLTLSMPTPDRFFHDGMVATVLGPRPEFWLELCADDPARGKDVFPWWDQGLGANYYLGRALTHMWLNVRPRAPMTEAEQGYLQDMLNCLDKAIAMAPELRYPWREWHEFLLLTQRNDRTALRVAEEARAEGTRRALFGYRRRNYLAVFPSGWRITLPGMLAEQFDGQMWSGWDGERTVQVGDLSPPDNGDGMRMPAEKLLEAAPPLGFGTGEDFERRTGEVVSKANLHEASEDGRDYWRLGSVCAVDGSMVVVTINFDNEEDREWAIGVWNSIHYVQPQEAGV